MIKYSWIGIIIFLADESLFSKLLLRIILVIFMILLIRILRIFMNRIFESITFSCPTTGQKSSNLMSNLSCGEDGSFTECPEPLVGWVFPWWLFIVLAAIIIIIGKKHRRFDFIKFLTFVMSDWIVTAWPHFNPLYLDQRGSGRKITLWPLRGICEMKSVVLAKRRKPISIDFALIELKPRTF